jgi:hypothetical protein
VLDGRQRETDFGGGDFSEAAAPARGSEQPRRPAVDEATDLEDLPF